MPRYNKVEQLLNDLWNKLVRSGDANAFRKGGAENKAKSLRYLSNIYRFMTSVLENDEARVFYRKSTVQAYCDI